MREKEDVLDVEAGGLCYRFLIRGKLWADQFWREKASICLEYVKFEKNHQSG